MRISDWSSDVCSSDLLDHVTIRFGEFTAVQDANLKIEDGEFFSFLGPSGCGKTTILRAVAGFLEPSEGAVRIGGRDMPGTGANQRPTPPLFPHPAPFPPLSLADHIHLRPQLPVVRPAPRRPAPPPPPEP